MKLGRFNKRTLQDVTGFFFGLGMEEARSTEMHAIRITIGKFSHDCRRTANTPAQSFSVWVDGLITDEPDLARTLCVRPCFRCAFVLL